MYELCATVADVGMDGRSCWCIQYSGDGLAATNAVLRLIILFMKVLAIPTQNKRCQQVLCVLCRMLFTVAKEMFATLCVCVLCAVALMHFIGAYTTAINIMFARANNTHHIYFVYISIYSPNAFVNNLRLR